MFCTETTGMLNIQSRWLDEEATFLLCQYLVSIIQYTVISSSSSNCSLLIPAWSRFPNPGIHASVTTAVPVLSPIKRKATNIMSELVFSSQPKHNTKVHQRHGTHVPSH